VSLLTQQQLAELEAKVFQAQLVADLIAEVRHHREQAQVPIFVCPECHADEEFGFSCREDYVGETSAVVDGGGTVDIGNIINYNWVCSNCDSRGNIAWKSPA